MSTRRPMDIATPGRSPVLSDMGSLPARGGLHTGERRYSLQRPLWTGARAPCPSMDMCRGCRCSVPYWVPEVCAGPQGSRSGLFRVPTCPLPSMPGPRTSCHGGGPNVSVLKWTPREKARGPRPGSPSTCTCHSAQEKLKLIEGRAELSGTGRCLPHSNALCRSAVRPSVHPPHPSCLCHLIDPRQWSLHSKLHLGSLLGASFSDKNRVISPRLSSYFWK